MTDIKGNGGLKLVIAEKPSVALSLAKVIGATQRGDGYLSGGGYVVSWCVGHLIELCEPQEYDEKYKKWRYEDLPIIPAKWKYKIIPSSAKQYAIVKKLMEDPRIGTFVCATDAGREGELIFRLVYRMVGTKKPFERLWISSMEDSAIREGFSNLKNGRDYDNLYFSALCRQEADWLVGLNGTRLFTTLYGSQTLKVGRVQSPCLAMIVHRDEDIDNFKKEPYWIVHLLMQDVDASGERIKSQEEAEELARLCLGKQAFLKSLTRENKVVNPPRLYDLTSLQADANRFLGYTAKNTLDYTQSLYEKKLLTYPRTDSQYLSDDMGDTAGRVLSVVEKKYQLRKQDAPYDIKRLLNSSKVTDHHAIIPTVELGKADLDKLSEGEKRILFLVSARSVCAAGPRHVYEAVKAEFQCEGNRYTANGRTTLEEGWKITESSMKKALPRSGMEDDKDEKNEQKEQVLPPLKEGSFYNVPNTKTTSHMTAPPKHYTEDTLLKAMERAGNEDMNDDVERKGLGTTATRADIIEKLIHDHYVERQKKNLVSTQFGRKLIHILPEKVKSPKLTAEWENNLARVARGELPGGQFMAGINEFVKEMIRENPMDKVSRSSFENMNGSLRETDMVCPDCGGTMIKYKWGYGCSNYQNGCRFGIGTICGKILTENQVRLLLGSGRVGPLQGFVRKDGKRFQATLILTPQEQDGRKTHKIAFERQESMQANAKDLYAVCPNCKKQRIQARMIRGPWGWECSNKCGLIVRYQICGRDISQEEAEALLAGGQTAILSGFTSKTHKPFSAGLKVEGNRIKFYFPEKSE